MSSGATKQILFISPVAPQPDGTGIEQRAWSHLEALARAGDVHVLLGVTSMQKERGLDRARSDHVAHRTSIVSLTSTSKPGRSRLPGLTLLMRLLRLGSPGFRPASVDLARIREELNGECFDLVFCFRLRSFELWENLRGHVAVSSHRLFVDFDDIESLAIHREIAHERPRAGLEQSLIARIDALEASLIEARVQRTADIVGVCSEVDRQRLEARGCGAQIAIVPNTCALPAPLPLRAGGAIARVLFVGTMSYAPNADALTYFCESILPLLRQRCSKPVELLAVGRNPGPRLLALATDPAIKVTGGVDSVQPYYDQADLVIAPIRSGGGTRIKILEALGFQRAVVSTTLGAEGLDLEPNRDLVIADGPEAFANACSELLENDTKRHRLALQGRETVMAVYDRSRLQTDLLVALFGPRSGLPE